MKIGFIGLGIMGKPMACNLMKAGHELVVYDIVREIGSRWLRRVQRWPVLPKRWRSNAG